MTLKEAIGIWAIADDKLEGILEQQRTLCEDQDLLLKSQQELRREIVGIITKSEVAQKSFPMVIQVPPGVLYMVNVEIQGEPLSERRTNAVSGTLVVERLHPLVE
jgi:hypothetical protein